MSCSRGRSRDTWLLRVLWLLLRLDLNCILTYRLDFLEFPFPQLTPLLTEQGPNTQVCNSPKHTGAPLHPPNSNTASPTRWLEAISPTLVL